jgi:hypothetical protein
MNMYESGDRVIYRTRVPFPYLDSIDYPLLFVYHEDALQWVSNAELTWYGKDRPTISIVLNCLGDPDGYEAYFGSDVRFKFVLFLHYAEEGIVIEMNERGNHRLPLTDYVQGKRPIRLLFNNAKADSVVYLQTLPADDYVSEVLEYSWMHVTPDQRQIHPWPDRWSDLIFTQIETVIQ